MKHYDRTEKCMAVDAKTGNEIQIISTTEAYSHKTCDVCNARVTEWTASPYNPDFFSNKILIKSHEVTTVDEGHYDRTTWNFHICEKCFVSPVNISALKEKIPGRYYCSDC